MPEWVFIMLIVLTTLTVVSILGEWLVKRRKGR